MRMPSRDVTSDVIIKDKGTKRLICAEYHGQITFESATRSEKIPSILPINNKLHLSNENK